MNTFVGVTPIGWDSCIFLDVTKIVYFTRSTNHVRTVCGLQLQFTEDNMIRIMDKLDDIRISNTTSNKTS